MSMYFNSTQLKGKNIPPKFFPCLCVLHVVCFYLVEMIQTFVEYHTVCKLELFEKYFGYCANFEFESQSY